MAGSSEVNCINVLDEDFLANPFPVAKVMRHAAPVCLAEPGSAWTIWRYSDVKSALRATSIFSSSGFQAMYQPDWLSDDCKRDPFILGMDGDIHEKNRNLVNKAFLKRIIDQYEPLMRYQAIQLIEHMRGGAGEFIEQFAFPYTAATLSQIVGTGEQSINDLRHWLELLESLSPIPPERERALLIESTIRKQNSIFDDLIRQRREHPRTDLLSLLVRAEVDNQQLGDEALRSCLDLLITAGLGTTVYTLTNAILFLSRNQEVLDSIRRDSSLIPLFIEEMLRYDPATHVLLRKTTQPVTVAGTCIPQDALVCLMIGSANRDESIFEDADRFNIFRKSESSALAFGFGAHACVGLALAKLEMKVALEVITHRFNRITCPPDSELSWINSITTHGLARLPVLFELIQTHS